MTDKVNPKVDDRVNYHGSQPVYYGEYVITHVPENPQGRGYSMFNSERTLHNVHRLSFSLVETVDVSKDGKTGQWFDFG